MAIVVNRDYMPLTFPDDPDDYRPNSQLAIVIDPSRPTGDFVQGLTIFCERIAPGDRIPLHAHTIEEVFFIDQGTIEATLGKEIHTVGAGAIVFIPAGTAHGFRNIGEGVAQIHAVFPAQEIAIHYLERNPAPGTEGNKPGSPIAINVRELIEGDPDQAVRPLRQEDFSGGHA